MLASSGYLFNSEDELNSDSVMCVLKGPIDTVYEGYRWKVAITLPAEYPFKSPSVGFVDRIFHPNIDLVSGSVCLNALNSEWTPVYKLTDIIETLLPQLLTYPNAEDPLNTTAANLWKTDRDKFNEKVKEMS